MPVPDFQSLMLPLLKFSADGLEHTPREAVEALAKTFNLTDSDRQELLPSGTQRIFDNRVAWTKTHILKAGLIESPRRSYFKISDKGRSVLAQNPATINIAFLRQYPEYILFSKPIANGIQQIAPSVDELVQELNQSDPNETIERANQQLRQLLVQDLLIRVKANTWQFFEDLVVKVLLSMGYGGSFAEAGRVTQRTNDEGIDGIINEDILGLDKIYIQAKKRADNIDRPTLQSFAGAMGSRTSKGVFITTSRFTQGAIDFVNYHTDKKIVLIDGEQLANYMIDHNVGVRVIVKIELKEVDNAFFDE
ncbi:restriction endonuclease [Spirosoma flavum]|uniref:Winged helix-turn-helix domain-containing protein n=1 Tax=Spirosoma flavum TaxID=2048557 RepID=A0ABW6AK32_9BACT